MTFPYRLCLIFFGVRHFNFVIQYCKYKIPCVILDALHIQPYRPLLK